MAAGVPGQLAVAGVYVDPRQTRQPLVRDRRHQDDARGARAVVLGGQIRAQVGGQILLESTQTSLAVE